LLNASRRPRDNPAMPHDFHRHDVIVIGGGRSGALASHWLACR
jgi:ribulose 1,5-bisphosphate synthetase/thiazole synthase